MIKRLAHRGWWLSVPAVVALTLAAVAQQWPRPITSQAANQVPQPVATQAAPAHALPTFTIYNQPLNPISPELFGQFMERASFGEAGPENALVPGTHDLQPKVVELLRQMHVPIVRFPAGGDIDFMDWTDLIDHAPGRAQVQRPPLTRFARTQITTRFGFTEYFKLAEKLHFQSIIPVNLRDAVAKRKPLHEAALAAAGLVAYCNAPQGAALPPGMPDWPAARAQNGHPEPYKVRYFQLGNEWWLFREEAFQLAGKHTQSERLAWLLKCLIAYMDAMRAVDPSIEFVMDGPSNLTDPLMLELWASPEIKRRNPIATFHHYEPGPMQELTLHGQRVPLESLSRDELWRTLVTMPGEFGKDNGCALGFGSSVNYARKLGYRVASTEWNWMAFGYEDHKLSVQPAQAASIGAANFLNGLLRQSGQMTFATQSMLVGANWPIACIQTDPTGRRDPTYSPSGIVGSLYAREHGDQLLRVDMHDVPMYTQPYQMGWAKPYTKVATLDVVATGSKDALFLHIINRDFRASIDARFDLAGFLQAQSQAVLYRVQAPAELSGDIRPYTYRVTPLNITSEPLALTLPPRSVSILRIPLAAGVPTAARPVASPAQP